MLKHCYWTFTQLYSLKLIPIRSWDSRLVCSVVHTGLGPEFLITQATILATPRQIIPGMKTPGMKTNGHKHPPKHSDPRQLGWNLDEVQELDQDLDEYRDQRTEPEVEPRPEQTEEEIVGTIDQVSGKPLEFHLLRGS